MKALIQLKTIFFGLFFAAILAAGCSEEGLPTGPASGETAITTESDGNHTTSGDEGNDSDDGSDSDSDDSVDSTDNDTVDSTINNTNDNSDEDSDTTTETTIYLYTFDDLNIDCSWDPDSFPNPYGIMSFEERPRWALCSGSSVGRMSEPVIAPMDSDHYRPDVPHTTVAHLDEPAETVTLHTANHRAHRSTGEYYSALIAYDEQGNEIDIDENLGYYLDNDAKATRLTVTGTSDKQIHSFGLSSYQSATYFDNIEIIVGGFTAQVADLTPPEIFYTVEHEELWPPNQEMVLAVSDIIATDDSGGPVNLEVFVESNEPVDGLDDETSPDWEIVEHEDGSFDVYLRAERSGKGDGRVYTVLFRAEDEAGNVIEKDVQVRVPHDKGGN